MPIVKVDVHAPIFYFPNYLYNIMEEEKDKQILFTKEDMEMAIRIAWRTSYNVESVSDWVEDIISQVIDKKLNN